MGIMDYAAQEAPTPIVTQCRACRHPVHPKDERYTCQFCGAIGGPGFECSRIADNLFIGSHPFRINTERYHRASTLAIRNCVALDRPADLSELGITMVALCAAHLQPEANGAPWKIVRARLHDEMTGIANGDVERAVAASKLVAEEMRNGGKVLCTCREGMNRSAWVAGLALCECGVDPIDAVELIRERRHGALYNGLFRAHIQVWRP